MLTEAAIEESVCFDITGSGEHPGVAALDLPGKRGWGTVSILTPVGFTE